MDTCSDQRKDDTKDLLWGTEMDQLKEQRRVTLTRRLMEARMDLRKESMKDAEGL